ncbi:hypothetical protein TBLA_0I02200 [Henningerozyma blattae CBS 6284]|uniref:Uncharacterized protein n=1 Tax=Henningerozyma blattae (strain ATCC 34711 / CBS 6284 / DSM 70876 / NBRC 10599 / NRRL Y-10934 / UCD 77-7) TaxID=1071380 RepID=I2H926_HENB6|nr:hypothetical protein TBLA_0I02200 [Tetrapisispora blattae CBS 6284]CCH62878.1 hypothetical protein TBLA_0I02200 [Tetrapisispora blattae CBS 6284]
MANNTIDPEYDLLTNLSTSKRIGSDVLQELNSRTKSKLHPSSNIYTTNHTSVLFTPNKRTPLNHIDNPDTVKRLKLEEPTDTIAKHNQINEITRRIRKLRLRTNGLTTPSASSSDHLDKSEKIKNSQSRKKRLSIQPIQMPTQPISQPIAQPMAQKPSSNDTYLSAKLLLSSLNTQKTHSTPLSNDKQFNSKPASDSLSLLHSIDTTLPTSPIATQKITPIAHQKIRNNTNQRKPPTPSVFERLYSQSKSTITTTPTTNSHMSRSSTLNNLSSRSISSNSTRLPRSTTSYNINSRIPSQTINSGIPSSHTINSGIPSSHTINSGIPSSHTINSGIPSSHSINSRIPSHTINSRIPSTSSTSTTRTLPKSSTMNNLAHTVTHTRINSTTRIPTKPLKKSTTTANLRSASLPSNTTSSSRPAWR